MLQQLFPLPPVPPHTFSSIWEREVGFVDMTVLPHFADNVVY